uniref:YhbP family protein n=1 Tax=Hafnia alvei TaxID=569 RepID=UPI00248DE877|nr:YhbP family protein [Hafnia alvei]
MTTDKEHICRFLHAQHVLTLGTCWEGEMWCANCFYVFDEECMALYFMTETRTRHGGMLLKNPRVAGTIAHQTKTIALIRGLQFSGEAVILEDENEHLARSRYYQQFPAARLMPAPVWQLSLNQIKMTDNKLGFAKKIRWERTPAQE